MPFASTYVHTYNKGETGRGRSCPFTWQIYLSDRSAGVRILLMQKTRRKENETNDKESQYCEVNCNADITWLFCNVSTFRCHKCTPNWTRRVERDGDREDQNCSQLFVLPNDVTQEVSRSGQLVVDTQKRENSFSFSFFFFFFPPEKVAVCLRREREREKEWRI